MNLGILVVTYFCLTQLISGVFVWTGLSPNGLTNNAPHWKFVLGFNHSTSGRYTDADGIYLRDSEVAWQVVLQRICVPFSQLLDLFKEKIRIFWDGSDFGWTFSFCASTGITIFGYSINTAKMVPVMTEMSRHLATILYFLVVLGSIWYIRQKHYNNKILLLLNQVFVTFGVYLLIEVQARYAYHVQTCVLILSALGIQAISNFLGKRLKTPKLAAEDTSDQCDLDM